MAKQKARGKKRNAEISNAETIAAMEESIRLMNDPNVKGLPVKEALVELKKQWNLLLENEEKSINALFYIKWLK